MTIPGINKVYVSATTFGSLGSNVATVPGIQWDAKKYLNIWIMKSGINASLPGHALAGFSLPGVTTTTVDAGFDPNTLAPAEKGFVLNGSDFSKNVLKANLHQYLPKLIKHMIENIWGAHHRRSRHKKGPLV